MKTLIGFVILLTVSSGHSQDIIMTRTGENIQSKIKEVEYSIIKYKKFENQSGPLFTISKRDVLMVCYENGNEELINDSIWIAEAAMMGKQDAKKYYDGKTLAASVTTATTIFLSPLFGIIPAVVCASSEPDDKNLNYPNKRLMEDPVYNKAYTKQAYKTKKIKIWKNFAIGTGVFLVYIAGVTALVLN